MSGHKTSLLNCPNEGTHRAGHYTEAKTGISSSVVLRKKVQFGGATVKSAPYIAIKAELASADPPNAGLSALFF